MKPSSPAAFRLLMEGSSAFADMEARGMRVDTEYLEKAIDRSADMIREQESRIKQTEIFQEWRKLFGSKTNIGSPEQLGKVLFGVMGWKSGKQTKTGKPKVDIEALESINDPFIKTYLSLGKLKKAQTYLIGIRKETVEGVVHPFINLHTVWSYRSSANDPNIQNQPVRDPRQAKLIRRAFVPRDDDYVLAEIDYSALEFRGAANFWKDPKMLAYASDSTLDIHRDVAAECYLTDRDEVSKGARTHGKNSFVFPILYGSYYGSCGPNLWARVGQFDLRTKSGVGLYEHMAKRGIKTEEQFIEHIKEVENTFHDWFPGWSEDRDEWWRLYLDRGWFELQTGFVCKGVFSYNNLMNTPIQGPSFHCLLWSLIELNRWLKENRFKSMIIAEIHDSMIIDLHRSEIDDVLSKAEEIMTLSIREAWKWILTPLEVEVEIAERNWFEKAEWTKQGGRWKPATYAEKNISVEA